MRENRAGSGTKDEVLKVMYRKSRRKRVRNEDLRIILGVDSLSE